MCHRPVTHTFTLELQWAAEVKFGRIEINREGKEWGKGGTSWPAGMPTSRAVFQTVRDDQSLGHMISSVDINHHLKK